MVEQSGEAFLLPFFGYLSHTAPSLGHSCPALCRARVGSDDVLLGPRPSLPHLCGRLPFVVRLVHRCYGVVRLLPRVPVRRSILPLPGPVWLLTRTRHAGGLPVLVPVVSQRARVLRLRRINPLLASNATRCMAFPLYKDRVGILMRDFSKLNRPAHRYSVYASSNTSRCRPQDSRPGWSRCSAFP
jgi:hypothetical protein